MTSNQDPDLNALTSMSGHLSSALGAIEDHQLTRSTPCADWDLAALVDHVTGGNWFTGQILAGKTADEAMSKARALFGDRSANLEQAAASVNEQLTVFGQPSVLDRTWHHVAGELTGRQILRLRLQDLIVHTWDIEQTIDPPASIPADLVRWGLAELSSQESLTPELFELNSVPRPGRAEQAAVAYLARFGR